MIHRKSVPFFFPPGTCKQSTFYWRGGDVYKEKEHLQYDYIQAKTDNEKAKKELAELKKEYDEITKQYQEKDEEAVALSRSLGGKSKITVKNSKLTNRINKLNEEIHDLDAKISEETSRSSQMYVASLEKEKSEIYVEIEKQTINTNMRHKEMADNIKKHIAILSGDDWKEANNSYAEFDILSKEKSKLKSVIAKCFADQNFSNEKKEQGVPQRREKVDERIASISGLLRTKNDLANTVETALHEKYMSQVYKRSMIWMKIQMIDQINIALEEMGLEKVNTNELLSLYLPEKLSSPQKRATGTNRGKSKQILRPKTQQSNRV